MSSYEVPFEKQKEQYLRKREDAVRKLKAAQKSYDKLRHSIIPRKEIKLQYEKNKVTLCLNRLQLIDDQLKFLRPGREDDISYRLRQSRDFGSKMEQLIPDDLPLRFHGCPIYAAEKIIASGGIISNEDRLGLNAGHDDAVQIYITTRDNLYLTVQEYTDLTSNFNLPAGCIFVVTPKDLNDEKSGRELAMSNVWFKNDPDRLIAVISSPENIPALQSWLSKSGQTAGKAIDFDGFVRNIDKILDSVHIPYRSISGRAQRQSTDSKIQDTSSLASRILDAKKRSEELAVSHHSYNKGPVERKGR